ncbi:hypothetical protein SK128_027433 [Halocaridina rubra]|uniref:Uncharacterized protein n=1 Tax=Halocaridina rubra TaxID=373956 RepID=A0AAN8X403_HALRR
MCITSLISSLALAGIVVMFTLLGIGTNTLKAVHNQLDQQPPSEDDDYTDVREEAKNILEMVMDHIETVKIVLYILLGLVLLCVITSSMLIHGVRRNRRGLLVPYIFQEILNVIALVAISIWGLVIFGTQYQIVSSVIGLFIGAFIHCYFALVVFSQYQALGLIRMHEEISMK